MERQYIFWNSVVLAGVCQLFRGHLVKRCIHPIGQTGNKFSGLQFQCNNRSCWLFLFQISNKRHSIDIFWVTVCFVVFFFYFFNFFYFNNFVYAFFFVYLTGARPFHGVWRRRRLKCLNSTRPCIPTDVRRIFYLGWFWKKKKAPWSFSFETELLRCRFLPLYLLTYLLKPRMGRYMCEFVFRFYMNIR